MSTSRPLRVAVLFNTKDRAPDVKGAVADDLKAEFDTMETVHVYTKFIAGLGHDVIEIHGDEHLVEELRRLEREGRGVDICWNTCEGYRGLDRESHVPALLEMAGIPYTFGRPMAMAITLDKAMTKRVLAFHGISTPAFQEFASPDEPICASLAGKWPLFVKPNSEGTGMGITAKSLVRDERELRERLSFMLGAYGRTALVEEFIPGRDLTLGVVGNVGAGFYVSPISEVDYAHTKIPAELVQTSRSPDEYFYCRAVKALSGSDYRCECPAKLPDEVTAQVRRLAVDTFRTCMTRDGARVDLRLDTRDGAMKPYVLEINAIPGMTWESDLTQCIYGDRLTHEGLIQNIFAAACDRYGLDHRLGSRRWQFNFPSK